MYQFLRPAFFRFDPENIHHLTLRFLGWAGSSSLTRYMLRTLFKSNYAGPSVEAFGLAFPNPIGLAAGYDKDGLGMHGLSCLGFGHLELGTVTLNPQQGNPRPRIFRLQDDQALINRMGFPNKGANALLNRLRREKPRDIILGINIGKGMDTPFEDAGEDYVRLLERFSLVADYIAINVSSPNTIGLRRLQAREHLDTLLRQCVDKRESLQSEEGIKLPLLVKLAPDLTIEEVDDAIDVLQSCGFDGVIATNTTISREGLISQNKKESGGLSGAPLQSKSLEIVSHIYRSTSGSMPIIGVGGIMNAADAKRMIEAGASLVQIYTGLVFEGPGLVRQILQEFSEPTSSAE